MRLIMALSKKRQDDEPIVKSAKRVLEIFEYFVENQRPASVNDIVSGLGYPQSSTSALLKSLTLLRYLQYNRVERTYYPTMRVSLLGGWLSDELFSGASLSQIVNDLHKKSGQSVIIGLQNDIYAQYVYVMQPKQTNLPWYLKPGSLRPLCNSAIGRIILSYKSDVEVMNLYRKIYASETQSHKRIDSGKLILELDKIRHQGYAYTEGTVNPKAGVIATHIPTQLHQPIMAIGIGGSIEVIRKNKNKFLKMMQSVLEPYQIQL